LRSSSLFLRDKTSSYYYVGGFNPVGFAALAAGVVTYIYLLDPVTYVYRPPFQFLTASFPAAFVSGVVYLVGALLFLRPRGIGGYGRTTAADAATDGATESAV
jgi:NCS1 family nucleobase:cation symporter-1